VISAEKLTRRVLEHSVFGVDALRAHAAKRAPILRRSRQCGARGTRMADVSPMSQQQHARALNTAALSG
jgi:hypothetical protein